MGTSKSSPVRFIGQGPLPEFEYSQQPLPDNIRYFCGCLTVPSGDIT
jgi:hypothetical protein